MSKKNKQYRAAKKKQRIQSSLHQHHREGKTLVPPLKRLPGNMQYTRWVDQRMPEMLWACLVRAVLPRNDALQIFREVAKLALELRDSTLGPDKLIPAHARLAEYNPQLIPRIVELVARHPLGYAALRPLLLFDGLPARAAWAAAIGSEPIDGDTDTLMDAVVEYLDHQSEHSTDVRWLICVFGSLTGKVHYPQGFEKKIEEMRLYPDYGDMRKVRPSVRAQEQMFWGFGDFDFAWSAEFWDECHGATPCLQPAPALPVTPTPSRKELAPVFARAVSAVSQHWIDTTRTTAVDAGHEGMFAFVLYALRCLLELTGGARVGIAGRLLLRTLVECRITLAYLVHKNDAALWEKFRRYGAGQAKLALLKISESATQPHSVSAATLEAIANEDFWEEFVDINLGNWAGIDLRKIAEESGTKAIYDAHFGWDSAYVHGQWAALRDATLTTCLNPLHRAHRIPLLGGRQLNDAVIDGLEIVEGMITDLLRMFPGPEISLRPAPVGPTVSVPARRAESAKPT